MCSCPPLPSCPTSGGSNSGVGAYAQPPQLTWTTTQPSVASYAQPSSAGYALPHSFTLPPLLQLPSFSLPPLFGGYSSSPIGTYVSGPAYHTRPLTGGLPSSGGSYSSGELPQIGSPTGTYSEGSTKGSYSAPQGYLSGGQTQAPAPEAYESSPSQPSPTDGGYEEQGRPLQPIPPPPSSSGYQEGHGPPPPPPPGIGYEDGSQTAPPFQSSSPPGPTSPSQPNDEEDGNQAGGQEEHHEEADHKAGNKTHRRKATKA